MKKRIFAIIICIALLCPLASCSDKFDLMKLEGAERADAFFDLVKTAHKNSQKTVNPLLSGFKKKKDIQALIY